ncbi:MAG: hypothetical protein ACOY33_07825 [Pseudomonadota bacterium]
MSLPHVAFRASAPLTASTQEYIELLGNPRNRPNPALLADVMNHFTRDSIDAFMLAPVEQLGITGGQRRLVEFVAETVHKSTQVVMKATVNKLDHDQHRRCAEYMDAMRLLLPHEEGDGHWYVSFPAPAAFAQRARTSMHRARTHGPKGELQETMSVMKALTDLAIENYYERPLALLRFGPILSKVSDVAIGAVRKGSHSTIDNLFPKLSEEQLAKGVDYFDALLIDVPRAHLREPVRLSS